jgi:cytochrome c1
MKRRFALALLALVAVPAAVGCSDAKKKAALATGGDPDRGREELRAHGCGACHTIPGVPGANALVGPPLEHMASRSYVAGTLPNNPDNLRRWIMHPQHVKPNNAMPEVGVTEAQARDMTAYLYTLE